MNKLANENPYEVSMKEFEELRDKAMKSGESIFYPSSTVVDLSIKEKNNSEENLLLLCQTKNKFFTFENIDYICNNKNKLKLINYGKSIKSRKLHEN